MNDYTLYLVKRAYYKKQLIKQAGNPINKMKLHSFKSLTDPDYANKAMTYQVARLGVPQDKQQFVADEALRTMNEGLYGQPTIPDDVLANPGQALKDRGLSKGFGPANDDIYKDLLRLKRNGGVKF